LPSGPFTVAQFSVSYSADGKSSLAVWAGTIFIAKSVCKRYKNTAPFKDKNIHISNVLYLNNTETLQGGYKTNQRREQIILFTV